MFLSPGPSSENFDDVVSFDRAAAAAAAADTFAKKKKQGKTETLPRFLKSDQLGPMRERKRKRKRKNNVLGRRKKAAMCARIGSKSKPPLN